MNFGSLKSDVQEWLDYEGLTTVRAYGLGKGCRGVELMFHKESDVDDFLKKYQKLETVLHNGWFTKYGSCRIYVSMTRK